jgi:uncharacterized protein (TIGR02145 family)
MKKLLFAVIIAGTVFLSCKKQELILATTNIIHKGTDTAVTISGTVYPVVQIGSQSWTSVNYRGPGGIYNNLYVETDSLGHGKLYTPRDGSRIVLPIGWHVPTLNDFITFMQALGATQGSDGNYSLTQSQIHTMMAKKGWTQGGGTNACGFNILPMGFYSPPDFYGTYNSASFLESSAISGLPEDLAFMIGPGATGNLLIFPSVAILDNSRCSIRFGKNN